MIIIAQVSFPRESLNQAVKAYVGLKVLPVDIVRTGPFFKSNQNEVQAITFYRFNWSDDKKCLDYIDERYRAFEGVTGFKTNIERWLSFDSAIERFLT